MIEGPVAEDAASVAFGVMASGDVTAAFEAIGLAVRAADGSWTPIAVDDGGFEAAADASAKGWMRAGTAKNVEITPADRPRTRRPAVPADVPDVELRVHRRVRERAL